MFHSMLDICSRELRLCDGWKFLKNSGKLVVCGIGIEAEPQSSILPDGYTPICFGIDDVACVDINEEMVAAEKVGTQHRTIDISQHKGPLELAEVSITIWFLYQMGQCCCH